MNKIRKMLVMDKETWRIKRKEGFKSYMFKTGLFKIGTLVGIMTLTLSYLSDINHSLGSFDIWILAKSYLLPYYPICLIIGAVIAFLTWRDFENRFGGKSK